MSSPNAQPVKSFPLSKWIQTILQAIHHQVMIVATVHTIIIESLSILPVNYRKSKLIIPFDILPDMDIIQAVALPERKVGSLRREMFRWAFSKHRLLVVSIGSN
jgi:hypothetical protein